MNKVTNHEIFNLALNLARAQGDLDAERGVGRYATDLKVKLENRDEELRALKAALEIR